MTSLPFGTYRIRSAPRAGLIPAKSANTATQTEALRIMSIAKVSLSNSAL
jgi:hypothetical protein